MTSPKRPAAYVRHATAPTRQEMALAARQRGWPAPVIYAEGDPAPADGYSSALDRLTAAIVSGRHDAVLMTAPGTLGDPGPLSQLLSRCTRHGVTVSFIPPPVTSNQAMTEPAVGTAAEPPEREVRDDFPKEESMLGRKTDRPGGMAGRKCGGS